MRHKLGERSRGLTGQRPVSAVRAFVSTQKVVIDNGPRLRKRLLFRRSQDTPGPRFLRTQPDHAAVDVGRQSEAAFGSWSTARIGTLPRSSSMQPSKLCSTFHGAVRNGCTHVAAQKNPPPREFLGLAPVSSF